MREKQVPVDVVEMKGKFWWALRRLSGPCVWFPLGLWNWGLEGLAWAGCRTSESQNVSVS